MNKKKLIILTSAIMLSFVSGITVNTAINNGGLDTNKDLLSIATGGDLTPMAGTGEPGSKEDPAVAESLLNKKLGELNDRIDGLEDKIVALEKKINSGTPVKEDEKEDEKPATKPETPATNIGTATVTASSLTIRKGAGTSYAKMGSVVKGKTVTLLKKSGKWYQIKYGNITGWVSGDYLKIKSTSGSSSGSSSTAKTVTTTASGLNIRSGAGTNYGIVGSVSKGVKLTVIKKSGNWYNIKYNNITGWVSGDYVK